MSYPGRLGGSSKLLTMREAAQRCRFTYAHFAAMYREWGIPYHRVGRKILFMERDIDNYLDRSRVA